MLLRICVALMASMVASPCWGEEAQGTGNQMTPICERYVKQPNEISACPALLRGVFEGHLQGAVAYGLLHNIEKYANFPFVWCPTDRKAVTNMQLASIYLKYSKERPEILDRAAANVAITAFMVAWPCIR